MTPTIQVHFFPGTRKPAPPILTEPEAMLLLRVGSKRTMTEFCTQGLRYDRRGRGRFYRLPDLLDFAARRAGVCL